MNTQAQRLGMSNMIILKAVRDRNGDLETALDYQTAVDRIDRDPEAYGHDGVTLYGREENGVLFYVVLSKEVIEQIVQAASGR